MDENVVSDIMSFYKMSEKQNSGFYKIDGCPYTEYAFNGFEYADKLLVNTPFLLWSGPTLKLTDELDNDRIYVNLTLEHERGLPFYETAMLINPDDNYSFVSKKQRYDIKKAVKESCVRISPYEPVYDEKIVELLEQNLINKGMPEQMLPRNLLKFILSSQKFKKVCCTDSEQKLVGIGITLENDNYICLWLAAFEQDTLKVNRTSYVLYDYLIKDSISRKVSVLDFGRGISQFKKKFGFKPYTVNLDFLASNTEVNTQFKNFVIKRQKIKGI
ncbi:GNAT family N-acetyltransferase [Vibrio brasiliensis]|uniref:GNAT family N-acetyltransferase n=1 Tax=Vibrio brasiliensis TaxID=170652 RepID=UPI001EFE3F80|nr:GNAT family N-acetyltransferase [Vibrio brasiliensis]MCG9785466.1 GNAT family N-acetyltransferase [Vibrio brasiliensis]